MDSIKKPATRVASINQGINSSYSIGAGWGITGAQTVLALFETLHGARFGFDPLGGRLPHLGKVARPLKNPSGKTPDGLWLTWWRGSVHRAVGLK